MPCPPYAFTIVPRSLRNEFDEACARLDSVRFASALWSRQLDVWNADPRTRSLIANRLGWLQAIEFVTPLVPRLRGFADSVARDGFTDVLLLGMGGSSLAPEVMRQVLSSDRTLRFRVLDSVDPDAVRSAMSRARDTLFVLASKSGSTIEPNVMAEEAKRRVIAEGHANWGSRFVAITDQDTALHRRAVGEQFRDVFVNPADIGGRYSALSLFGMVPAALMGLDIDALLNGARAMEQACRNERAADNPGLALGALLGAGARSGRDKMMLWVPSHLQSFGLWVEQLVAESTGKHGKGLVPITEWQL
jgi:glucose-6-phosphate isomerase